MSMEKLALENEEIALERARTLITSICDSFYLKDNDDIREMILNKFREVRPYFNLCSPYRAVKNLVVPLAYLILKLQGIPINLPKLIERTKISKIKFSDFILQVKKFIPEYRERNRQNIILKQIHHISEIHELGDKFFNLCRKILKNHWERLKNSSDDVVVGVVSVLSTLQLNINKKITWAKICEIVGINMLTLKLTLREFVTFISPDDFRFRNLSKIYPPTLAEFRINNFLTLKLEGNISRIYVKGERFLQCMRLVLNIQKDEAHEYDEIDSIDEAVEINKKHLWRNRIVQGPAAILDRSQNHTISPEQEFMGHCSNLQVWAENNYDTRLLHSNLSFPLLKKLTEAGDPTAGNVFKGEIAQRLQCGHPSVIQYLIVQGYIDFLTKEDIQSLDIQFKNKKIRRNLQHLKKVAEMIDERYYMILKNQVIRRILRMPICKFIILFINLINFENNPILPEIIQFFEKTQNDESIIKDSLYYGKFGIFFFSVGKSLLAEICFQRAPEIRSATRNMLGSGKLRNKYKQFLE